MTQDKALEILKSGKNVFLTGEAGAGKSYTINQFVADCKTRYIYPEITASTGIAATHINGVTIHSWAGIGIKEKITDSDVRNIMGKPYVMRRIDSAKVLIIDEVSMLNAQTIDNVDKVCRAIKDPFMPFGGLQVIFVGDFFQLPPVSKGEKLAKFAFESDAWLAAEPAIAYLHEQHRQDDAEYLEILNALRTGTVTEKHIKKLKTRNVKAPKDITRLFTHNADVDIVNAKELANVKGEVRTYRMQTEGIEFMIEILKRNCLSPEKLDLKVGAKVMFTRNDRRDKDREPQFVNGTLGEVTEMNDGHVVVLTRDGREVAAEYQEWSIDEKGYKKAAIKQIPLRLAYAITVHKCQGMSLDAATINLSDAFEYGQGYVALSRVRSLAGLYLEGLNTRALEMHPTVVKKDGLFRKLSD